MLGERETWRMGNTTGILRSSGQEFRDVQHKKVGKMFSITKTVQVIYAYSFTVYSSTFKSLYFSRRTVRFDRWNYTSDLSRPFWVSLNPPVEGPEQKMMYPWKWLDKWTSIPPFNRIKLECNFASEVATKVKAMSND